MSEEIDRLRLVRTEGVGPITYRRLLARFGSAAAALAALPRLARAGGRIDPLSVPTPGQAEAEFEAVGRSHGVLIFLGTPAYPALLALLEDAPPMIAVQGRPEVLEQRCVGMVGSRNASANGLHLAARMAEALAAEGLAVVSGLARGIDTACHEGALRAGGATVACIAGGLDRPYPPQNAALQARIAATGAVITEAPPGTLARGRLFPRRNRLIAGLSLGVVVVEAATNSGSLITAHMAQEAGRAVFAVPGSPFDPRARGTNDLIRQGAKLVEGAEEILPDLPRPPADGWAGGWAGGTLFAGPLRETQHPLAPSAPEAVGPAEESAALARLKGLLGPAPTDLDDLIRACDLPVPQVMGALLSLELAGRIEMQAGNKVALLADPGH